MSYRPITDNWLLTRCRYKNGVKRYGGYLGGFPERARVLIGCPLDQPMMHVCGGLAREYPYKRGFGPFDMTMDLDPSVKPDFLKDCRDKDWPINASGPLSQECTPWGGILIDSAYSEEDQTKYGPEVQGKYPNPHQLIETAINTLRIGYKVGMIHYVIPRCPKNAIFIADIGITCGFGNRKRAFTVFERTA